MPDGSGSLLSLNFAGGNYTSKVYGNDAAIKSENSYSSLQTAALPVFGVSQAGHGFFSIIENAAEEATISTAKIIGNQNPRSSISAGYIVWKKYYEMGKDRNLRFFESVFTEYMICEAPSVRYVLLSDKANTYSDMANYYREYLKQKHVLQKKLEDEKRLYQSRFYRLNDI